MIGGTELDTGKGQDMVRYGQFEDGTNGNTWWMVIADGHGRGKVIEEIRNMNWEEIIQDDNPLQPVISNIESMENTKNDGSTLSVVKISKDSAKCWWIGDSQIRIYKNNEPFWRSQNHNFSNESEMHRVIKNNMKMESSWTLHVLDDHRITMQPSKYVHHTKDDIVAMTRALGHNNSSYGVFDYEEIKLDDTSKWRVLIASDGIWDIMFDADESILAERSLHKVVELAVARWNQDWIYTWPGYPDSKQNISDQMDDIGIVMWENNV